VFLNDSSIADKVWLNGPAVARDQAPFLLWYRASGGGTFGGGGGLGLGGGPGTGGGAGQLGGGPAPVYGGGGDKPLHAAMTVSSAYANLTLDGGSGNSALAVFDFSGGASWQDRVTVIGLGEVLAAYPGGCLCTITYQNLGTVNYQSLGPPPNNPPEPVP